MSNDAIETESQQLENSPGPRAVPEQLQPHAWRPGQSGNPAGRPRGATPGDYLRHLCTPDCTEASLRRIVRDKDQPVPRRAAAKALLAMLDDDSEAAGRAMERAMDRTEGKPAQRHVVQADHSPSPERALERARAELAQFGRVPDALRLPAGDAAGGAQGETGGDAAGEGAADAGG